MQRPRTSCLGLAQSNARTSVLSLVTSTALLYHIDPESDDWAHQRSAAIQSLAGVTLTPDYVSHALYDWVDIWHLKMWYGIVYRSAQAFLLAQCNALTMSTASDTMQQNIAVFCTLQSPSLAQPWQVRHTIKTGLMWLSYQFLNESVDGIHTWVGGTLFNADCLQWLFSDLFVSGSAHVYEWQLMSHWLYLTNFPLRSQACGTQANRRNNVLSNAKFSIKCRHSIFRSHWGAAKLHALADTLSNWFNYCSNTYVYTTGLECLH